MVPVDRAGLKALNKTGDVKYAQVIGSDPNNPTYGGNLEVFHQIHCLVRLFLHFSYILLRVF